MAYVGKVKEPLTVEYWTVDWYGAEVCHHKITSHWPVTTMNSYPTERAAREALTGYLEAVQKRIARQKRVNKKAIDKLPKD